jgi:hypothetical protein
MSGMSASFHAKQLHMLMHWRNELGIPLCPVLRLSVRDQFLSTWLLPDTTGMSTP